MTGNKNAPHVANIRLVYEIMEQLPTGEASGWPIKDKLTKVFIKGQTYDECLEKTNLFFTKLETIMKDNI